ncbi:PilZ domain-containing protein [Fusibacter sp. JL298sf-3]
MKERRKTQRMPYSATISVEEIYNQDTVVKEPRVINIDVHDISKGGMGFFSAGDLPVDYYFNAKIDLGTGKKFFTVLRIIRKVAVEGGFQYGCEFTGLADILRQYFDDIEIEE